MLITPEEYEQRLEGLSKAIRNRQARYVTAAAEISLVRAVASTWFQSLRPVVLGKGLPKTSAESVDGLLEECVQLTLKRSARTRYQTVIKKATTEFKSRVLLPLSVNTGKGILEGRAGTTADLLNKVSPGLSTSYQQVLLDLAEGNRLSYRGTANELREILRDVLRILAPDSAVMARSWYQPVEGRAAPTHQQRATYILETKGAGRPVQDVGNRALSVVDEGLAKLARDMLSRTSHAAHIHHDIDEIMRMVHYFDALVSDLCEP